MILQNDVSLLFFLGIVFIFRGFDLEQKLPQMRAEVEARKAGKSAE